jgi:hypothetical protein
VPPGNQLARPQLPIQPDLNPNSRGVHQTDILNLPSYSISTADLYEMNIRSGRTIDAQPPPVTIEQLDSEGKESEPISKEPKQTDRNQASPVKQHQFEPPYPERLTLSKSSPQAEFDLLGELENLFVKIPLLQAMKDVPIYAKNLREYCLKKSAKKSKNPLTIHVMGKLSDFMMGKSMPEKYGDSGNPILTVQINGVQIPNVLVDLGAAINVITTETMHALGLRNLKHTPTILELADRSTVKPIGKLEYVTISVDSWNYPIDFLVL